MYVRTMILPQKLNSMFFEKNFFTQKTLIRLTFEAKYYALFFSRFRTTVSSLNFKTPNKVFALKLVKSYNENLLLKEVFLQLEPY